MSKKAIFAQASEKYWIDVAASLRDKYGWEICYFIGNKKPDNALKLFPHTVFHTKAEIRKSLAPEGCKEITPSPLDKPLLSSLSEYESIFLKMMDRQNYNGSLTYFERISTYHSQIMYWKAVLEHFKPDVVVYRIAPHVSHDYALYALCQIMNIPTIMFERTSLPGFVYPVSSIDGGSEIIQKAYTRVSAMDNVGDVSLSPETISHLQKLKATYANAMPFTLKYKLAHYKGRDGGGTVSILLRIAKSFAKAVLNKSANLEGGPNYTLRNYHKSIGRFKRKKLLAHYNRLANDVNLAVPYVFVALQCEPERQTCPVGGVFGNQYLIIDMLSKLIPQDWKIYVKEHISQFKIYQAPERAKPIEFYNMIASMPNVAFVPLNYTSFELIDSAKASATVSGTVGWESVVRGKPALLFGHSWYKDCAGVFVIDTIKNCQEAIRKIANGFQININEVKAFAKVVESCSVRAYIDLKIYDEMNLISPEENVENLAKAIHEFNS